MKRTLRRIAGFLLVAALVGALVYAFIPAPVEVEVGAVSRGAMQVTVDEDGRTRIKEEFTVSAPLAGRLARITLDAGDPVQAGVTLLASIDPLDPSLLDPRALAEAEARASAAQAALDRAGAAVAAAAASFELAQTELARLKQAGRTGGASLKELDDAALVESLRSEELRAATFARDVARFELEQARAALMHANPSMQENVGVGGAGGRRFEILAPVSGRVLRVLQESAGVVSPGQPLIQIGDPTDLEVEVDVLSTDAVPIRPGAPVSLERWGGDHPLRAAVRLVEPAAFLKISALGVEEQRVNVIIDFVDAPEARAGLGDAFRVEARIVVWQQDDVLKVPTGALFRDADSWAVFVIQGGRARTRRVSLGRRNSDHAQVLEGLAAGDTVILYPGDTIRDGVRVASSSSRSAKLRAGGDAPYLGDHSLIKVFRCAMPASRAVTARTTKPRSDMNSYPIEFRWCHMPRSRILATLPSSNGTTLAIAIGASGALGSVTCASTPASRRAVATRARLSQVTTTSRPIARSTANSASAGRRSRGLVCTGLFRLCMRSVDQKWRTFSR